MGDMDGQTYTGIQDCMDQMGAVQRGDIDACRCTSRTSVRLFMRIDDQVKKVRTQFPVKKDRRDALYRQFYEI